MFLKSNIHKDFIVTYTCYENHIDVMSVDRQTWSEQDLFLVSEVFFAMGSLLSVCRATYLFSSTSMLDLSSSRWEGCSWLVRS